jgi:O-6-methylguanine DNA methyltransferase
MPKINKRMIFMRKKLYLVEGNGIVVRVETMDGWIASIGLSGKKAGSVPRTSAGHGPAWLSQFNNYLKGKKVEWDLPLDLELLTPFQKLVFEELVKVSFGKTVTYEELAVRVKNTNYRRAVAMALSANPFPVVIPCHRVVAKNGLGGFSCGIGMKKKLLELEGAALRE